jgi:hypothetical protein
MFKYLFLLATLLASALSIAIPEEAETRFNKHMDHFMDKVDDKLEEVIQINFPLLSDAMLVNNKTVLNNGLRSTMVSFKHGLRQRMRKDIVDLVAEIKETRESKDPLSMEEKMEFSDKLQKKWDASLAAEMRSWMKQSFTGWVDKAQKAWIGLEEKVKSNLEKLEAFVKRNHPAKKKM